MKRPYLTFDKAADIAPVWTKDSKRIAYVSAKDGAPNLFWKPADGTGQPEPLLPQPPSSSGALVANGATPDGKTLIFSVGVPSDIMALPLQGDRQPRALIAQPFELVRDVGDAGPYPADAVRAVAELRAALSAIIRAMAGVGRRREAADLGTERP